MPWEETPCSRCVLPFDDKAGGHGRGVSLEAMPPGEAVEAMRELLIRRKPSASAVPPEVEEAVLRFVLALADMSDADVLALRSWLRGETATAAARRHGITAQAENCRRWKMLEGLGIR